MNWGLACDLQFERPLKLQITRLTLINEELFNDLKLGFNKVKQIYIGRIKKMGKVNALLTERLKKTENSSKMAAMAKQSANGNLTSFSGVFSLSELSDHEKTHLKSLLEEYALNEEELESDFTTLLAITSEVKAINNQAALLHGERIKKAHYILARYRDGAFTAWLLAAYGNRQTPYNLMKYYEFCEMMPKTLRYQIEAMPRQAIYTLASREGPLAKKQEIVENYKGQTKAELLGLIRETFPLDEADRRNQNLGDLAVLNLRRLYQDWKKKPFLLSRAQKEAALTLIQEIERMISIAKVL